MSDIKTRKVAAKIREEIGTLIIRGIIKDPRVTAELSVTEVDVAKDTSTAKVYISGFGTERNLTAGVEALNHAAGFIQSRLAKTLHTRNTPKLRFFDDHSIEYGTDMIQKLKELDS